MGYKLSVRESLSQSSAKTTILFLVKRVETLFGVYPASHPMVTREFCGVIDRPGPETGHITITVTEYKILES